MGNRNSKQRRKEKRNAQKISFTEEIERFKISLPIQCENKTLSQVIELYCSILNKSGEKHFRNYFTSEELNQKV